MVLCALTPFGEGVGRWKLHAPSVLMSYLRAQPDLARDYEIEELGLEYGRPDEAAARLIANASPFLVGFSAYVWNIERTLGLCRALKARLPGATVLLGGPQVSEAAVAEWVLERHAPVDAVVRGEGEIPLAELLRRLQRPGGGLGGPGVTCRDSAGQATSHPPGPILEDLAASPSPYLSEAFSLTDPRGLFVNILWTRGCRHSCAYCSWCGTRRREVSSERAMEELDRILSSPDVRGGFFLDADFFAQDDRACAVLERLATEAPEKSWLMEADPGRVTDRALDLLARLPESLMALGLQSVTPKVLRLAGRSSDPRLFAREFRRIRQRAPGLGLAIDVMCGLPGDTAETYRDSLELALSLGPDLLLVNVLIPLPGTPFFRNCESLGICHAGPPTFRLLGTSTMPPEDFEGSVRLSAFIQACHEFPALRAAARDASCRHRGPRPHVSLYEAAERRMAELGLNAPPPPPSATPGLSLISALSESYSHARNAAALYRAFLGEAGWDDPAGWLVAMAEFVRDLEERFPPEQDLRRVPPWRLQRCGRCSAPFLPRGAGTRDLHAVLD